MATHVASRASDGPKNRESLLETLESIVVAFILAFVFRAFIVEAFVIPTGSMAPTLHGAHLEFVCPSCGYEFSGGADRSLSLDTELPRWFCPNCFYPNEVHKGEQVFSGDRVLVLKYLYDFQEPRRWDVIVFRNPNDPSQNYIKRLVGLPGEKLELREGDVTVNGRVVQKTDRAQDALWMIVHDTRRRPTHEAWVPRWHAADGWQADGTGFRVAAGPQIAWLTYEHRELVNAPGEPIQGESGLTAPSNVCDYYAYNYVYELRRRQAHVCTDLALRESVKVGSAQAVVVIELGAYRNRLRFELTAVGSGRPTRLLANGKVVAESADGVLPVGRSVEVLAANVDHKMMLQVDGRRPVKSQDKTATPEGDPVYEPLPLDAADRRKMDETAGAASSVRGGASGEGEVTIEYLGLWRDVYYTNVCLAMGEPGHATEGNPEQLGPDEFFVLGDNSPNSEDSRLWTKAERPVVPRRNLVGKAFFVYWPAAGSRMHIPIAPDPTGFRFVH